MTSKRGRWAGLVALFLAGCGTAVAGSWEPPKPANVREDIGTVLPDPAPWDTKAQVVVCSTSPFTPAMVELAFEVWASKGAPRYKVRALERGCDDREVAVDGVIAIDRRWHEVEDYWIPGAIAQTMTNSLIDPRRWAILHFDATHDDLDFTVLLHEVGHLWFPDVPDSRHIMSGYRVEGGNWSFSGVEEAFRKHTEVPREVP